MSKTEKLRNMRSKVKEELKYIPKGPSGSSQNLLRAEYWMLRLNSLSKEPEYNSKEEVLKAAVKSIRKDEPHFNPRFDKGFFEIEI